MNNAHKFSVGELASYSIGSDRYGCKVTKVNPSGKTVEVVNCDPNGKIDVWANHRSFRLNAGGEFIHNKHYCLTPGYDSHRDPSF